MTDLDYWQDRSDGYAEKYAEPERILEYEKRHRLSAALSLADIRASGRILDIGVGSGELFTRLPSEVSEQTIGIDFSREMLTTAMINTASPEYIQADGGSLPLNDDSVELVFCLGVIGHIPVENVTNLISEISRVLEPGGQLVLSFANSRSVFRYLRRLYRERILREASEYDDFAPEVVREYLTSNGLEPTAYRYLTYATGLLNTRFNRKIYQLLDRYASGSERLSPLAMTWVVSTRNVDGTQ